MELVELLAVYGRMCGACGGASCYRRIGISQNKPLYGYLRFSLHKLHRKIRGILLCLPRIRGGRHDLPREWRSSRHACTTGPILKASVPVVQFSMQQQKDYEMTPRRKIRRRYKLGDLGRRSVSYVPSGYREPVGALPVVSAGCICRDRHQPDKDGLIFTDPCCELHGVSSRRWAPLPEEVA